MIYKNYDIVDNLEEYQLDIICLSDASWDWILWTNRQYALSTLVQEYKNARVLFVEPPTFLIKKHRALQDTWPSGAAVLMRQGPIPFCTQVQERVWVLRPPLPVPLRFVRKTAFSFLQWETLLFARLALRRLNFGHTLLWTYSPYAGWYVGRFGESFRIYESLNEHTVSTYYSWDVKRVGKFEEQIIRAADVVFTVSPSLQERKEIINKNTFMVGNPTNYQLFAQAQERFSECPFELAQKKGSILGFYGALSEERVDRELMFTLMQTHPEWNLVLIGTVHDLSKWDCLFSLPNVLLLPAMPQTELVRYVSWFDVLLMPYQQNEYIATSSPLKLYEYFATGKPIVSTYDFAESASSGLVLLATDAETFAAQVQKALYNNPQSLREQRIALARKNTWSNKVNRMLALMIQNGLLERLDILDMESKVLG